MSRKAFELAPQSKVRFLVTKTRRPSCWVRLYRSRSFRWSFTYPFATSEE